MKRLLFVSASVLLCAVGQVVADTILLPVNPYLSFEDSPFATVDFSSGYFLLEDFEDGAMNTPGASASTGVFGPGGNTDSVDADDGVIDGSGTNGRALDLNFTATAGITVTFDAGVLGALPTHAGIVWTDGVNNIEFEAFGPGGASLGTQVASTADGSFLGGTLEDIFFGAIHPLGISMIVIRSGLPDVVSGIEADHLQYGFVVAGPEPVPVPEPSGLVTWACLFALGLIRFFIRSPENGPPDSPETHAGTRRRLLTPGGSENVMGQPVRLSSPSGIPSTSGLYCPGCYHRRRS